MKVIEVKDHKVRNKHIIRSHTKMAAIKYFLWCFFTLNCQSSSDLTTEDISKSLKMGMNSNDRVKNVKAIKSPISSAKSRYIQAIVNIIKKLKSSSGSQREKFISKVKKQFNFDDKEKWVVTKLRMILFRLEVDVQLLQIKSRKGCEAINKKQCQPNIQKETILMKAQRLKEKKDNILAGKDRKVQKSKTNGSTKVSPQRTSSAKIRKPRQSLEDKQLAKLRSVQLATEKSEPGITRQDIFHTSKLEFMRSFNLVPTVVYI